MKYYNLRVKKHLYKGIPGKKKDIYSIFLVQQDTELSSHFCQHAKTGQDTGHCSYLWTGVILIIQSYHPILSLHVTDKSIVASLDETQRLTHISCCPITERASRGRARGERAVEAARLPASGHWPTLSVPLHPTHCIINTHHTSINKYYKLDSH